MPLPFDVNRIVVWCSLCSRTLGEVSTGGCKDTHSAGDEDWLPSDACPASCVCLLAVQQHATQDQKRFPSADPEESTVAPFVCTLGPAATHTSPRKRSSTLASRGASTPPDPLHKARPWRGDAVLRNQPAVSRRVPATSEASAPNSATFFFPQQLSLDAARVNLDVEVGLYKSCQLNETERRIRHSHCSNGLHHFRA